MIMFLDFMFSTLYVLRHCYNVTTFTYRMLNKLVCKCDEKLIDGNY